MGFNDLTKLAADEAAQLLDDYWRLREQFLRELAAIAHREGLFLPRHGNDYRREHLLLLGRILESIANRHSHLAVPSVSPWLAQLHDPIDENKGLSDVEVWLGVATSFAFASALLNSVPGARIAIGREEQPRYVYHNQPVVKGKWYDTGTIEDVSCLAIARRAIRDIKRQRKSSTVLLEWFDKITSYAQQHEGQLDNSGA
jgi:hypothetical protein